MNDRKKIQLLTPDEIMELGEEYGFIYEPCHKMSRLGRLHVYWGCVNYTDGKMEGPYPPKFDKDWFTEEDYKKSLAINIAMHVKFVNEIFVFDMTEGTGPFPGYISKGHAHFDQWAWYSGHTILTEEERLTKRHLYGIHVEYGNYASKLKEICDKHKKV